MNQETNTMSNREPIRASVATLAIQLVSLLVFTDLIYSIINFFLMKVYFLQGVLPFDTHRYIVFILAVLHIGKSIFQVLFVLKFVMKWIGSSYFIDDTHLVKRDGIISVIEKTFDLDNIRSITINQGILGKIFNFGDIVIEISAPGDYLDQILLSNLADPQKFEQKIRGHCKFVQ